MRSETIQWHERGENKRVAASSRWSRTEWRCSIYKNSRGVWDWEILVRGGCFLPSKESMSASEGVAKTQVENQLESVGLIFGSEGRRCPTP